MNRLFAKLIEPPKDHIPKERQMFSNADLKALIIPLVIEQILAMLVGVADTMMVSQAGEAAISGVSLVDMINGICLYVFNALATGGTIVVSQFMGSKDIARGRKAASQLVMITVALSLTFLGAMTIGNRGLLGLLFGSIEPDVMDAALTYLIITAFSYPFMAAYSAFCALFRSMGNSKITMKVSLGMNVMNVIGNAIAVFVLDAGVAGVAVSSLLSRVAAATVLFVMLLNKDRVIHLNIRQIFTWDGSLLAKILSIAIPSGVESGMFQICRVVLTSIIATFGTAQIAANGVAVSIDNINTVVNGAMMLALPTVVGRCVGAGDYDQASYYTKKMLLISQFGSMIVNFTLLAALPFILNLYALSDEARKYAAILVCIHTFWTIVLGSSSGPLPSAIRAAGDAKFTMTVSVVSLLFGRLFFSIVFSVWMDLGIIGMWLAMGTHWVINSICGYWRFRTGRWKNRRLV